MLLLLRNTISIVQLLCVASKANLSLTTTEARSRSNKLLTNTQESVLIEYIRKISNQGLHATPKILENIVVELLRKPVGGRWIERFIKRYENEFESVYLRSIDQSRHIADNSTYFEHYFALVRPVCLFINLIIYIFFTKLTFSLSGSGHPEVTSIR